MDTNRYNMYSRAEDVKCEIWPRSKSQTGHLGLSLYFFLYTHPTLSITCRLVRCHKTLTAVSRLRRLCPFVFP